MARASLREVIFNPAKIIKHMGGLGYLKWIPDKLYLNICYKAAFGKKLNLENPETFNEKLQWLKLYNRKEIYTSMVDKYEVKKYVADIIGEKYIIPTYGVWENFDDINFSKLPDKFVLKCTHDSGGIVICKDKKSFDLKKARSKINKSMKRRFFYVGREWPYKNVKPRIIAEKYMETQESDDLQDYKLMCFGGKVYYTLVCQDRYANSGLRESFFDNNWNLTTFRRKNPLCKGNVQKPQSFDEMVLLAEKLSDKIPFLRVDFYEIDGRPYFGEMTFFPGNGFEKFEPDEYDLCLGELINLPK